MKGPGHDALWLWFGLSYASFIVVPRVLAHEMPDDWQAKMAELLNEYDEAFPNFPVGWSTRVQFTIDGKLAKWPGWALNYRHPDLMAISAFRAKAQS